VRRLLPHDSRTCSTSRVTTPASARKTPVPPPKAADPEPLGAPLVVGFDYTRSLGPTLSRFATALRSHRVLGVRGSDGLVHAPPPEYDPVTAAPLTEFVDVGPAGEVVTWSWQPKPLAGQPLEHPFAWALIRLDGADTPMLHAIDAPHEAMRTGMRVRVRWATEPTGGIRDIACFEPADAPPTPVPVPEPAEVTMVTTPIKLEYWHTASVEESKFLRGLTEGRLLGQRCPVCGKVYVPPRGACPVDGVPTTDEVELADRGTVTTFCVVNVPFLGQRLTPPYVTAYVLLDGADIAFQHLILEIPADQVRMGMRVEAVWRPRAEWGPTLENIDHFRPTGEPDAAYESYAQHL
jgi:uncharacterized OB-fold protein